MTTAFPCDRVFSLENHSLVAPRKHHRHDPCGHMVRSARLGGEALAHELHFVDGQGNPQARQGLAADLKARIVRPPGCKR